ncbi:MAG: isochorismatase family protein [Chitinophagales bacterium]
MNSYRLTSENVLILVIDLQEKLLRAMPDRDPVTRNTTLLLKLAELFEIPVIVTEQYPRGLGKTIPEIQNQLGEHFLIEKVQFSAYLPELSRKIDELKRKQILVVGTETHVCVFQTVRDLVEAGFNVHVAKDAVCSRFPLNHQNGVDLMQGLGAVITNTETVIFDILGAAGTEPFKVMSPLVK